MTVMIPSIIVPRMGGGDVSNTDMHYDVYFVFLNTFSCIF